MSAPTQPAEPAWLAVAGLACRRGARTILRDVGLHVAPGQVVGLLGHNGSGKSTLLRALLGLVPATASWVQLQGRPSGLGARLLRAQAGVVQQSRTVDGKLSVAENLWLGGRLYGLAGAQLSRAVQQALEQTELAGRAHERLEQLSGGLQRRVELARALLHQPLGLLLDEPTQGLDAAARHDFWARVREAARTRRQAVLVATHDASEAAGCDWLYLLRDGQVIEEGSVADLLAQLEPDVLTLGGPDLAALQQALSGLHLGPSVVDGDHVRLACRDGHRLVVPVVERLGSALVHTVSVRRASLADVFLHHHRAGAAAEPAPFPLQERAHG